MAIHTSVKLRACKAVEDQRGVGFLEKCDPRPKILWQYTHRSKVEKTQMRYRRSQSRTPIPGLARNPMAIHTSVQERLRKQKKPAALKGLPRRSPTPVLPEPYATLCPSSDGIGCLQHSMAADNHHGEPQPPYGLGVIICQYTHRSSA